MAPDKPRSTLVATARRFRAHHVGQVKLSAGCVLRAATCRPRQVHAMAASARTQGSLTLLLALMHLIPYLSDVFALLWFGSIGLGVVA